MALRLVYFHIAAALGIGANILYANPPGQPLFLILTLLFYPVAAILLLSMLVYTLRTLAKQKQWGWFRWVLGSLVIFFYPVLGLWSFSLFGPTTPALEKPSSQDEKG
jgi:hypothetical protein